MRIKIKTEEDLKNVIFNDDMTGVICNSTLMDSLIKKIPYIKIEQMYSEQFGYSHAYYMIDELNFVQLVFFKKSIIQKKFYLIEYKYSTKTYSVHRDGDLPAIVYFDNKGIKTGSSWFINNTHSRISPFNPINIFIGEDRITFHYRGFNLEGIPNISCLQFKKIDNIEEVNPFVSKYYFQEDSLFDKDRTILDVYSKYKESFPYINYLTFNQAFDLNLFYKDVISLSEMMDI